MKDWKKLPCPVPPWTHKTVRELAAYLNMSLSKLALEMGIPKDTVYGWTRRKTTEFDPETRKLLEKFRKQIAGLRKKALNSALATEKSQAERRQVAKTPLDHTRIKSIAERWGWSIVESAVFSGVSYDTITSWFGGRRTLKFLDKINMLKTAEDVAKKRKFSKSSDGCLGIVEYAIDKILPHSFTPLVVKDKTRLPMVAMELTPGKFKVATAGDQLEMTTTGIRTKVSKLKLTLKGKKLELTGKWQNLRTAGKNHPVIELFDEKEILKPLAESVGCVVFRDRHLAITLWTKNEVPVRLIFGKFQ